VVGASATAWHDLAELHPGKGDAGLAGVDPPAQEIGGTGSGGTEPCAEAAGIRELKLSNES
jgi:hypothetical protein